MLQEIALSIAGNALETGRIPHYIKAGMMTHMFPKKETLTLTTMFHAVHCTLTNIICHQKNISVTGIELIPDSVVKHGKIYKHNLQIEGGKEFSLIEVVKGMPDQTVSLLSRCVLERNTTGCVYCAYGTKQEEDISCEGCGGNKLKPYLESRGLPSFSKVGWKVFGGALEHKHFFLMSNMSHFYQRFMTQDDYVKRWEKGLATIKDSALFGSYIGEEMESVLFRVQNSDDNFSD